jgi:hypothetical protein
VTQRLLRRIATVLVIVLLYQQAAAALEMRLAQLRVADARIAMTVELRDLLRERFAELIEQGRAIFLEVHTELWEDRRLTDRLALTTTPVVYRVLRDATRGILITDQYGNRSTHADEQAPLPVRVDVGPTSAIADDRSYYLHTVATAATFADRDIDQMGIAIFGDEQSAAGLANLGRFVLRSILRVGRYLESASAELTTPRYTGVQIKTGVI